MKLFIKARQKLLARVAAFAHKQNANSAQIGAAVKSVRRRLAARRLLRYLAGIEQGGSFSVRFVAIYQRGRRRWTREVHYPRQPATDIKRVERLLYEAHPKLNRKERRHLARDHRWLFLSHA